MARLHLKRVSRTPWPAFPTAGYNEGAVWGRESSYTDAPMPRSLFRSHCPLWTADTGKLLAGEDLSLPKPGLGETSDEDFT